MMDPWITFAIFAAYFITDMLYACYVRWVSNGSAVKAAFCTVAISLLMSMGIMQCIDNPLYLIPLSMGAWLGTYVAIKFKTLGEKK